MFLPIFPHRPVLLPPIRNSTPTRLRYQPTTYPPPIPPHLIPTLYNIHCVTMEASISRAVVRRTARQLVLSGTRQYSVVHDVPRITPSVHQTPPPPTPKSDSVFDRAINATGPRNDWTKDEISEIHQKPLMELAFAAVCPLTTTCSNTKLMSFSGRTPPPFPPSLRHPTLHSHEHQDRRLLRRLLLLRSILPL